MSGAADGAPHRDHHRRAFGADVTYDDLVRRWRAESWDPTSWIELFEAAGAKYFMLVAKHHDGAALWPTATSDRRTGLLGPKRDIVGDLLATAEGSSLHSGLFYAMAEWFTPAPRPEQTADPGDPLFDFARYRPSILWFDLPGDPDYYRSHRLIADYDASSAPHHPDGVAVNDRAGLGAHGDFHTYEYGQHEPPPDRRSRSRPAARWASRSATTPPKPQNITSRRLP